MKTASLQSQAFIVRDHVVTHRTRIISTLIVAGALYYPISAGALLVAPIFFAALPPLLQSDRVTAWVNRLEIGFASLHQGLTASKGKFRWLLLPLTSAALLAMGKTDRIQNPHVRAGVQLGWMLLSVAVAAYGAYMAAIAAVAIFFITCLLIGATSRDSGDATRKGWQLGRALVGRRG